MSNETTPEVPGWLVDALIKSLTEHLFRPTLAGVSMSRNDAGDYVPHPVYNDPPLAALAALIFHQNRDTILAALWDHVTVDEVAARIAKTALSNLEGTERSTFYRAGATPNAETVRKRVGELVAQGLAERQLQEWDARQAEGPS